MNLLSEAWPRIGTCHLDYGGREGEHGQSFLVGWPAAPETRNGL